MDFRHAVKFPIMAAMRSVAAAIILSTIAFAQNARRDDIVLASKSPLLLARYIEAHKLFNWDALTNALGIREKEPIYAPCGGPKDVQNPCSTSLLTVLNPDQQILIIQGELLQHNDVYLRYLRKSNGEWTFAGKRTAFVKEFPRRHEAVRLNGKPLLKIASDHSQIGGALVQEVEDWIDLAQPGFDPVFSFTPEGSYSDFSFAVWRTIRAQAIPIRGQRVERIDLVLNVKFEGPGMSLPATYVGVYERAPGEKKFTIRRAYSDQVRRTEMPAGDFEGIGGVSIDLLEFPNERLLFYAFPGLQKIASGSDKDGREWLQLVLDHTGDCPEKRSLLDLLAKH
jgi:hypothetical protein